MPDQSRATDESKACADPDAQQWLAAFIAANRKEPDHWLEYEAGWFVWRNKFGLVTGRVRRTELRNHVTRLMERANAN